MNGRPCEDTVPPLPVYLDGGHFCYTFPPGQGSHKSTHSVRSVVGREEMRLVLILSLTVTVSLGKPNFGFARFKCWEASKDYIKITTTKFTF